MPHFSISQALRDAGGLWAKRWIRLLPLGVVAHVFAFALILTVDVLLERHPIAVAGSGLGEDAPASRFIPHALVWLLGPLGAFLLGGAVLYLLHVAICRVELLDEAPLEALSRVVAAPGRVLRRFVAGVLMTAVLTLIPIVAGLAIGGPIGLVVIVVFFAFAAWVSWPRWELVAPVTVASPLEPYFFQFRALAPPTVRRKLAVLAAFEVVLSLIASVPLFLAITLDPPLWLLWSVAIPFWVCAAPFHAFVQVAAYRQLVPPRPDAEPATVRVSAA